MKTPREVAERLGQMFRPEGVDFWSEANGADQLTDYFEAAIAADRRALLAEDAAWIIGEEIKSRNGDVAQVEDRGMTEAERIKARVQHWLEHGGTQKLEEALRQAERDNEQLRRDAKPDWRKMMEPMTI